LIEQIGSYAGLAAIPGLAVLSALYFSQARDVRRLREWAGRAPERAAEQAMGGRVPVQASEGTAAAAGQPAGATVARPAVAAAAGAGAATQNDKAADAAGTQVAAAPPGAARPAALTPAAVASAAAGTKVPARAGAAGGPGGSATGTVARPGPPAVGAGRPGGGAVAAGRRPIPRVNQTSVLGPAAKAREPWYRRLGDRLPAGRYVALIVAGALVLGGGAAFGISQLASSDSGGEKSGALRKAPPADSSKDKGPAKKEDVRAAPTVDPSKVTVTVVNGTTIPNLARDTAGKLSSFGFQIGNKVTGTGSLAAAESVVEYKPGCEDEGRYVAGKLNISQKQPADPDAIAQAGPACVIVVLGADQAPGG
jgi:hypothetical protein